MRPPVIISFMTLSVIFGFYPIVGAICIVLGLCAWLYEQYRKRRRS